MEKSDGFACIWSCNGSMFCQESGTFAFAACFVEKIVLLWILGENRWELEPNTISNWGNLEFLESLEFLEFLEAFSRWKEHSFRNSGGHTPFRQFSSTFHVQAEPRSIERSSNLLELPGLLPKIEFSQHPPVLL